MHKPHLILLTSVVMTACANPRFRGEPVPLEPPAPTTTAPQGRLALEVSYLQDSELSTKRFRVLHLLFENPSAEWIFVDRALLDLGTPSANKGVFIPFGGQLHDFVISAKEGLAIRRNTLAVLDGDLSLEGMDGQPPPGGPAAEPADERISWKSTRPLTVAEGQTLQQELAKGRLLPRTHLLAGGFAVPPGMTIRKWILLDLRPEDAWPLSTFFLLVEGSGGLKQRLRFSAADASVGQEHADKRMDRDQQRIKKMKRT